jgi:DNA-binding transcriptional LysR family regulator
MRRLRVTMDGQVAILAVTEKGSFEAAAKYLGIGKSAVRKRVQSVESELGASVFQATRRGMMPTEAGNLYILAARESVRHAWLGVDRVQALLRASANDLRIGYSTFLNARLLDIVRRIQPEGTDTVSVTRESLMTHQVVAGVLQGDFHVGFGILPVLEPDLSTRLLFEEPLMAVVPVGHRLATRSSIRPEDLGNEPVISICRNGLPGRHSDIVTHFESLGVSLKFVADTYSAKEALWLVAQGTGVSLMTKFSTSARRNDVVVRPLSDRLLTLKSGIFARRDQEQAILHDFMNLAWAETATLRANPG